MISVHVSLPFSAFVVCSWVNIFYIMHYIPAKEINIFFIFSKLKPPGKIPGGFVVLLRTYRLIEQRRILCFYLHQLLYLLTPGRHIGETVSRF